ncbi:MAG: hypothetical protein K0U64_07745 [Actinomycetia bacterium]|nr:hypothetical protein [Actinomycetes bacterium]
MNTRILLAAAAAGTLALGLTACSSAEEVVPDSAEAGAAVAQDLDAETQVGGTSEVDAPDCSKSAFAALLGIGSGHIDDLDCEGSFAAVEVDDDAKGYDDDFDYIFRSVDGKWVDVTKQVCSGQMSAPDDISDECDD